MAMPGLLERALMPLHERLDALFFAHQRALLDRDAPRALRLFTAYREGLLAHAADEEAHVLPLYAGVGGDQSDSPSGQFRLEHDKLRRFLCELEPRLVALAEPVDDRELLGILDRESWFKNLFVHHDLRERNALYPRISAACSDAEQLAVWERIVLRDLPAIE